MLVDLDRSRSAAQEKLLKRFYRGFIPHVAIVDKTGRALYNESGEVAESELSAILDRALK